MPSELDCCSGCTGVFLYSVIFTMITCIPFFTGFWKDIHCAMKNAFICERHNSTYSGFAPTVLPPLGGCPESWLLFKNKVR